eukprot:scpid54928/ scgid10333/ ATP-binding cassette sub-family B member 10, mitochondrial; ABC-mitochondrial erythroid protein; ATP-binding cassette transporter 10
MLASVFRCARAGSLAAGRASLAIGQRRIPQSNNNYNLFSVVRRYKSDLSAANKAAPVAKKSNLSRTWQQIRKLFSIARPEYGRLACACVLLLISTGVTMAVPACIGKVIDMIYSSAQDDEPEEMRRKLTSLVQLLASIFVIGAVANCGRVYLIQTSGARVIRRLREKVFSNIVKQEMAFFDSSHSGQLVSRLSLDTTIAGKALTDNVSNGLRSLLRGASGLGMMYYLSPPLANASLIIVPPIACLGALYGVYIRSITQKTQDAVAQSTQVAEEKISNMRTVRYFGQEESEVQRYNGELENVLRLAYRESTANALFFGAAGLVGNIAGLAVLWKGGMLMQTDAITVGQLTSFLVYLAYAGISVGGLGGFFSEMMKGIGASTRLWELSERQASIPVSGGLQPDKSLLARDIHFRDVVFAYPTRDSVPVFSGLDLTLDAGSVTAVVGVSGSGKSSLASLLLRLYDCNQGSVLLGDTDIKQLDPTWFRKNVAIVGQEPVLFAGTIGENIGYGRPAVLSLPAEQKRKVLVEVAAKANAMEFIQDFPDQLDTEIGEHGVQLSGGQKQRIAIARALLKDPQILILDEATSALDARSEKQVQTALESLMAERTVLTIAHRLSTIRNADRIVVLRQGTVAEQGSYNELMATDGGHFRKLVESQALLA